MNLPTALDKILKDLNNQKWLNVLTSRTNVYLVGGTVRDTFIGKSVKDIDIVVENMPLKDIACFLVEFGSLVQTPVGNNFAVIKFKPLGHKGQPFDIAIPRTDKKIGQGHKEFKIVTKDVTILDDLKRRDFTANSIAVNIKTGELLDPFNGLKDLSKNILRATDHDAFVEDPLRLMRAIQFSSRFGFDINEETLELMKINSALLRHITGERILEEFEKVLAKHGDTSRVFKLLYETDIDKALFGKKMNLSISFASIKNLDRISFYYALATLTGEKSSNFYLNRLKGERPIGKALKLLDTHFDKLDSKDGLELRWTIFTLVNTSPLLLDLKIWPKNVKEILNLMKCNFIPMKSGEVKATGDDIKAHGFKNKQVGIIKDNLYKDALMNKFDWKNRESCLNHIEAFTTL